MKPGARLAAAVTVLTEITVRHRPAALALADWGKASRFAGSGDRAAVGNLVYDVLRRRGSIAARMGASTPRALVLGAANRALGLDADAISAAADGSKHALSPLTDGERAALENTQPLGADELLADVPTWIVPLLRSVLGDKLAAEVAALSERAPVDIRVNTLKATRKQVLAELEKLGPSETRFSPLGIRFAAPEGAGRTPNVEAEPAHGKGWFEVQDQGSQIAALLVDARPGHEVLDLCAGAGGKTLALAATMKGEGHIIAHDSDKTRLRPIFERLARSGAKNVEALAASDADTLADMAGRFDRVVIDAPCTGSGTWRRRPDAKWRLKPRNLEQRQKEQQDVLAAAAPLVKPGGRLVYITCSLLPAENTAQIAAFLDANPGYSLVPYGDVWREVLPSTPPLSADGSADALLLTPAQHGTDGFFIAILARHA
ncbi:MAG: MFS transporter [Alphaproteobacteria bacterium 64-6]|nr:RsmB/NOP family class I SAM-dependent RNA methyltransferase [Hyphomicrobium sp.]OJU22148.1 MAG: MFS transporter [Alphaproteobacteria bacterium 64-6]